MRVVFLSADLCDGGAQRVISVISGKLAEKGLEVYLYLFCRSEKDYPIDERVILESMCHDYATYCKLSGLQRVRYVRKYLKRIQPDIAVGFLQAGYALYLASAGLKIRKIASIRNNPERIDQSKGLRAWINRFWIRHADALILQNDSQKKYAAEKKWKNTIVISNPINDKLVLNDSYNYREKCTRMVMAGRLTGQKNYLLAIRAMKKLCEEYSDLTLHIYGEGSEKEYLLQMIEQYGLSQNVFLHGWTDDLSAEYQKGDMYLLTSDYEGMPNALMEAMALGMPCIATDCPTGPGELIKHGESGLLIPINHESELISAVKEMIDMTCDKRKRMGMSARKKILENYNSDVIADMWMRLFEKISAN